MSSSSIACWVLQMHRRSQEYQKVSYTRDAPVPGVAAATAEFRHTITTGDSATSSVGSQQQEVLADRVGGSNSRRSSRDIARQLTGHADSVQGSVGNEAELLLQVRPQVDTFEVHHSSAHLASTAGLADGSNGVVQPCDVSCLRAKATTAAVPWSGVLQQPTPTAFVNMIRLKWLA